MRFQLWPRARPQSIRQTAHKNVLSVGIKAQKLLGVWGGGWPVAGVKEGSWRCHLNISWLWKRKSVPWKEEEGVFVVGSESEKPSSSRNCKWKLHHPETSNEKETENTYVSLVRSLDFVLYTCVSHSVVQTHLSSLGHLVKMRIPWFHTAFRVRIPEEGQETAFYKLLGCLYPLRLRTIVKWEALNCVMQCRDLLTYLLP